MINDKNICFLILSTLARSIGTKSELQGKRWAYVTLITLIRVTANSPKTNLRPTFGLQEFSHHHIRSNNTTFGLPSNYREISHLRIIWIYSNYSLPSEKSL